MAAAYSQAQVQASLAANPNASKGGYEGSAPMPNAYGPASTVAPGSVDSAEQYAGATSAYQRALVRFNQQRTGLLQQYGYKGTIDPTTGQLTNVGVDTSNSHGQLQQLLGQQDNEDQAAQFSAEDRGLHGGLANQGESSLREAHMGESSDLGNSLFGGLSDLNSQQQDAQSTLDDALWQLQHSAASTAVDGGDFTPADITPPGATAPPGAKPTASQHHIPAATAAALVAAATRAGQPTSEHGAGSLGNQHAQLAAKLVANAYTNGRKKRG